MSLGEPMAIILRHTLYEGEVMDALGWNDEKRDKYHAGDPEARERVYAEAVRAVQDGNLAPDIEIYVDGGKVWTDQ